MRLCNQYSTKQKPLHSSVEKMIGDGNATLNGSWRTPIIGLKSLKVATKERNRQHQHPKRMEQQMQLHPQSQVGSLARQTETPLQALVKSAISSIRSQSVKESLKPEISKRALALRSSTTPIEVTQVFNPDLQTQLACVKDVSKIHDIEGVPTLKVLEQAFGTKYASRVWIKTQMSIVNDFSGTKEKLNDMQLDALCDQILVEYAGLNLMEFACFCSRLRSGKYEQFYGSVDPTRILTSLESFVDDWRTDLYKADQERERIRKEKEYEESRKNSISLEDWLATKPEEERDEIRARFGLLKKAAEAEDGGKITRAVKTVAKSVAEILKP